MTPYDFRHKKISRSFKYLLTSWDLLIELSEGQDLTNILRIPCMYLTFFLSCFGDNLMLFTIIHMDWADNYDKIPAEDSDKADLSKTLNVFHAAAATGVYAPSNALDKVYPSHKDAIRLSSVRHPSEILFKECKEICQDPEKRKDYFPEPGNTRRVRTWAGAIISPEQAAAFKPKLASHARIIRPFSKLRPSSKPKVEVSHYP